MKCPKCGTKMNQGIYAVDPPIPYVDCPKCGYHKEGDDVYKESMTNRIDTTTMSDRTTLWKNVPTVQRPEDVNITALTDKVDELELQNKVMRVDINDLRTDVNDLIIRISTLEADLEREKKRTRAWNDNLLDQIDQLREACSDLEKSEKDSKNCGTGRHSPT